MQNKLQYHYFFTSGIAISGTCVGTYDPRNYITSPNYPQQYGNDIDCRWLISSPGIVTLSFWDFKLQGPSDILKIYEGTNIHGRLIDTFSADPPSPIVLHVNNMYLRFTSNSYTTDRGFKIGVSGKYKYYYTIIQIF